MLNHLRYQALIWMIFCIMAPGIASAKGSGKAPAVVAPSWFGKVPSIQQQLEFHWLRQALKKSHDLRLQQAFEQVHLRFLEKKVLSVANSLNAVFRFTRNLRGPFFTCLASRKMAQKTDRLFSSATVRKIGLKPIVFVKIV